MNGFLLVIPLLFIRYGIAGIMGKGVANGLSFFPPTQGLERYAFVIYQVSVSIMVLYPLAVKIDLGDYWSYIGMVLYGLGLVGYLLSLISFGSRHQAGPVTSGLYRISRNPMYVAFFLTFLGIAGLTHSWPLLVVLVFHQISVHFLILSEERWCRQAFGSCYREYSNRVRRYL